MGRKLVAIFAANIYSDMVKLTQYGLIQSAKRNDSKLLFFTSLCDNSVKDNYDIFTAYDMGDYVVFLLPDLSHYDGLVCMDTYVSVSYVDSLNEMKKTAPCPVVTLGDIKDYSYNVVNDQKRSYREVIEHLIKEHYCTDIVLVSGHKEMLFIQERNQVFKETLEDYGLDYDENRIYYGNLWYSCGGEIVDQILKDYNKYPRRKLPDAIVCANDFTAVGIISALKNRGFHVPEDVIVTGYDNIPQAAFNDPTITTSEQPFEQVGKDGINVLSRVWKGEKVPHVVANPGVLLCRQSCGCEPKNVYKKDDLKEKYFGIIDKLGYLAQTNTNLMLKTSIANTFDEIVQEIEDMCLSYTGFKDAVLCLMDGWDQKKVITESEQLRDATFRVVCGVYNGKPVKRGVLPKGQLLPEDMMEDPEPYYIVPIHNLQYFMGYYIVNPDLEDMSQPNIKAWFANISTILENWRIKQVVHDNFERMRDLSSKDTLTGLFNRRGYVLHFEEFYNECIRNESGLAVLLIDMDNLKTLNDNMGHDEGDYTICAIASAMRAAASSGEICIRSGGDEFVVLAKDYDQEKVDKFISSVRQKLDEICTEDEKTYSISVSIGCYMEKPKAPKEGEEVDITEISEMFLREADAAMYIEKKQHKGIS